MAERINMPRLSDTMEEGVVAKWLKKVGDQISEGDILAEIETDKATMEFESFYEGTLLHIGVQEGQTAPVDTLLAIVGEEGEDFATLLDTKSAKEEVAPIEDTAAPQAAPEVETTTSAPAVAIPDGVEVIAMPRLSDTMEEGTVATWLKKVGDQVNEGDILAEIETDKATMEFESFYAGTLLHIGIEVGQSAKVDSLLAVIGPEGTDVSAVLAASQSKTTDIPAKPATTSVVEPEPIVEDKTTPATTQSTGVSHTTPEGARVMASPLAKKMAKDQGINLNQVQGTGENGRIVKRDIENFVPGVGGTAQPSLQHAQESFEEITNSQMRKVIAKRLSASKFTAPHYYLSVEFDMDNAIAFRTQYNTIPETKISFNDIVVKACALALKQHPQVNSQWFEDRMRLNHHVHIGVAVAVPDGLVVPVVRFANMQTLPQLGAQVKDYALRARDKKLTPAEMEGSTFTVSNLGMFGIQEFTSIINQPNSAILSVGSIEQKPVVKAGQIVVGNTMKLTLACDHRTVDGATGAQFLQTLRDYVENPLKLVL